MSKRLLVCGIISAFVWLIAVSTVSSQTVSENIDSKSEFEKAQSLIHIGDVLDVDIIGSTEYDWRGGVTPEGAISGIDYLEEPLLVSCRSTDEVAADLVKSFSKVLREPKIVVRIVDRSARPNAFIYGAIKTPQRFSIQRVVKLSELIIISGGFTENLSGEIEITRPQGLGCYAKVSSDQKTNQNQVFTVKVSDILSGAEKANIVILNGDIITVTESEPIYVIGGVSNPSTIKVRSGMTLTRAIAIAGGLVEDNNGNDIVIYRRDAVGLSQIKVNLEDIKTEKIVDLILQKYDVVEVNGKGGRKNDTPPAIAGSNNSANRNAVLPLRIVN